MGKRTLLILTCILNVLIFIDSIILPQPASAISEPVFLFPWDRNENPKYFTGGPHPFGGMKSGVDFIGGEYQVLSIESGVVSFVGQVNDRSLKESKSSGTWSGTVVVITHDNGIQSEYWHLDGTASNLSIGHPIPRGYPIGQPGCTGDGARKPFGDKDGECVNHLHLEFRRDGIQGKDGEWKRGSPVDVTTITLDGWSILAATEGGWDGKGSYEGTMTKPGEATRTADTQACGEKTPGCFRNKVHLSCSEGTDGCAKIRNDLESTNVITTDSNASKPEIDYFALGDSIASGHGLMDKGEERDPCRRSASGYPHKVAKLLATQYEVHWTILACSGAATRPIQSEPRHKWFNNQVDDVLELLTDRPTIVSITIGANDFEWTRQSNFFDRLYVDDDPTYQRWVDDITTRVKNLLTPAVKRLLMRPNVFVVITELYNPFNRSSLFFKGPSKLCGVRDCYTRTEYAPIKLNAVFLDILKEFGQPERLQITALKGKFQDHSSPRSSCGGDQPDANQTWIQYKDDLASNSDPSMPWWLGSGWHGDCFHPNEKGAQAIADAVYADALRMLPDNSKSPGALNARIAALPKFPILEPGQTAQVEIVVKNTGPAEWPAGRVALANESGESFGGASSQLSEPVPADAERTLTLTITAPEKAGFYSGIWKMKLDGKPFGYAIPLAVVVVPRGSSDGLKGILQKALDDARQQLTDKLNEQFEKAWEDFKQAIEKRIEQEINRQVNRATGGLCGAAPAGLVLAGGIAWWRRKRRSGMLPPPH